MPKKYKIHPVIGVARLGDSTAGGADGSFVGPEIPGADPAGPFKDANGQVKRQAARFRVYEYDDADPTDPDTEITAKDPRVQSIEWTVHLANKKASWFVFGGTVGEGPQGYPANWPHRNAGITDPGVRTRKLIIDPGPRTVRGANQSAEFRRGTGGPAETFPDPVDGRSIDALGEIRTDEDGRLSVLGGHGVSIGPIPSSGSLDFANNDGWFDDTSDGPVTAAVVFKDGTQVSALPAWIIVAPPDFAPGIANIVTMYDVLYDMALRVFNFDTTIFDKNANPQFNKDYKPSFSDEVGPILKRALDYQWVNSQASAHVGILDRSGLAVPPTASGADPNKRKRSDIFTAVRDPRNPNANPAVARMPQLHGDNGVGTSLTVTVTQYEILRRWASGGFVKGGSGPAVATTVTAKGLDRAALEACAGGAFFPGIEAGWILRNPQVYAEPFRLMHFDATTAPLGLQPGDVTKRSALPWQADFLQCSHFWWPAQRPNEVFLDDGSQLEWDRLITSEVHMVRAWPFLGFVVNVGADDSPNFVERGRDDARIKQLQLPAAPP
jgi:hypothetical protein